MAGAGVVMDLDPVRDICASYDAELRRRDRRERELCDRLSERDTYIGKLERIIADAAKDLRREDPDRAFVTLTTWQGWVSR